MGITKLSKVGFTSASYQKYDDFLAGNEAFSPSSYESIASATGTGSAGSITFSSIPSTYTHLQIRGMAQDSSTQDFGSSYYIRFNSDTGTNYARHTLQGDGTNVNTWNEINGSWIRFETSASRSGTTNTMGTIIIDILDSNSTTKNKTVRAISGVDNNLAASGSYYITLTSGVWMNTSAITSITLVPNNNWTTRTTFALYGIKGA